MSESKITTIFKGEFVQVDLVDETIELTVENNVYSRSESLELLEELKRACALIRSGKNLRGSDTDEYLSHYPNHLPRLMAEIENRAERRQANEEN